MHSGGVPNYCIIYAIITCMHTSHKKETKQNKKNAEKERVAVNMNTNKNYEIKKNVIRTFKIEFFCM